jgi:hypothetical protein
MRLILLSSLALDYVALEALVHLLECNIKVHNIITQHKGLKQIDLITMIDDRPPYTQLNPISNDAIPK